MIKSTHISYYVGAIHNHSVSGVAPVQKHGCVGIVIGRLLMHGERKEEEDDEEHDGKEGYPGIHVGLQRSVVGSAQLDGNVVFPISKTCIAKTD